MRERSRTRSAQYLSGVYASDPECIIARPAGNQGLCLKPVGTESGCRSQPRKEVNPGDRIQITFTLSDGRRVSAIFDVQAADGLARSPVLNPLPLETQGSLYLVGNVEFDGQVKSGDHEVDGHGGSRVIPLDRLPLRA